MADPYEIAREALELAEKATPGPWTPCGANDGKCSCGLVWSRPADLCVTACHHIECPDEQHSYGGYKHAQLTANQHMIAHAGTHYAALCRALLAQRAVVEAAVAQERAEYAGSMYDFQKQRENARKATNKAVRAYLAKPRTPFVPTPTPAPSTPPKTNPQETTEPS